MTPSISIIIPNWNNANLIGHTLESVSAQTYSDWECIIVDDRSDDNSLSAINSFIAKDSRIRLIKRDRSPKGASTCRNIGASQANGDWLIFLDSDDLLAPHCLETRLQTASKHENDDFFVYPIDSFSSNPKVRRPYYQEFDKKLLQLDPFLLYLSARGPFQTTCFFWKTSFFNKINGFDEAFPRAQDAEISLRAFYEGNYKLFTNLPADCHYRNDPQTNRKSDSADAIKEKRRQQLVGLKLYSNLSYAYLIKACEDTPETSHDYWQMFQMQANQAEGFFRHSNYWTAGYFQYLFNFHQRNGITLLKMARLLCGFVANKGFLRACMRQLKHNLSPDKDAS